MHALWSPRIAPAVRDILAAAPLAVPGEVKANVKKLAAGLGIPQSADR
jgi:hypothetical protein